MAKRSDWYIPERTRALATMYLTRRPDLTVRYERGSESDLLVEVGGVGRDRWSAFSVVLMGSRSKTTIAGANKYLNKNTKWMTEADLAARPVSPTCLFYFTMEDDAGYFTWMAEPIVGDNSAKLKLRKEADCRILDRAALDGIVETVRDWYNAFYGAILA